MDTSQSIQGKQVKWKCVLSHFSRVQLFVTPWTITIPGSSVRGDSPGKNTGVGCRALLQETLPDPGSKPPFPATLALQADSLPGELVGKPMIKDVVDNYAICISEIQI